MSKMLFLTLTSIRKPEISAKEGQQATPMDWHLGLGMSGRKSIWSKNMKRSNVLIPEFSARRCFWNNCFPSAQPPVVNPAQPDVTAPPAQALKPLDGELQPPAVPASAQHFSYEIRLSSQRQLTWAKGSIQTPDGILSVSWELLENGEKQVEWSLAPAGEDKVPTM